LVAVISTSRPRWLPQKSLRPYAYLPGMNPHPVRDPAGHSHHVEPIPVAADASLSSDAFLWGLDLFNHGYYWEAHEAWEGLWQVAGRDGPLRMLFKGLILLSAAGLKIRELKNAAARRHAMRAAALLRQLMKVPDSAFERALGMSPAALADCAEVATRIPLNYKPRRLNSLDTCSISFSKQIPAGARADLKRGTVVCRCRYEFDTATLSADVSFSFWRRDPSGVASFERSGAESEPEIPLLLAPPVLLANDNVVYHSGEQIRMAVRPWMPCSTRSTKARIRSAVSWTYFLVKTVNLFPVLSRPLR
jgi:DUF309 family protein family protein